METTIAVGMAIVFCAAVAGRFLWAMSKPEFEYVSHRHVDKERAMITVKRRDLNPPWSIKEETWLLEHTLFDPRYKNIQVYQPAHAIRKSDGWTVPDEEGSICRYLLGIYKVKEAESK